MRAATTLLSVLSLGLAAVNAAPGRPRAPTNIAVAVKSLGVPPRSSPCMATDSNSNGASVHPSSCPDGPSSFYPNEQLWTFVRGAASVASGFVQGPSTQITFFDGQFCLDLTDGNTTPGTKVQIWECAEEGTNPNQQWTFNSDATITLASDASVALELPESDLRDSNLLTVNVNGKLPKQTWNALPLIAM